MSIRFRTVLEADVPTSTGPSLFVDTDGTPKLKQADGSVDVLLDVSATKVVLGTGDPPEVADATVLFGKDYGGTVELAIQQGTQEITRVTQGSSLASGVSNYFPTSQQQTNDQTIAIPASPTLAVLTTADAGGLIEVTTTAPHGMLTGATAIISGVVGTTEANGSWTITSTGASTFTLDGSAYVNAYVSDGTVVKVTATDFVLDDIILVPTPAVWCVYQCHIEIVSLNENYQTQTSPPDYDDMRGLVVSGDFALMFDDTVGDPDVRYANGGVLIPVAIFAPLAGTPYVGSQIAPTSILVDEDGVLSLRVTNSGTQAYWAVLYLSVSPPITIPGPP